jgi:AcrR family transcriptional regulator
VKERPYHHGNLRRAPLEQAARTVRKRGVQELSLRELAREVGVSHGAPRRVISPIARRCSTRSPRPDTRVWGAELRSAIGGAGEDFEARLQATAAAYVRLATRDAALLELMFAGTHREESGTLHEAADRAFAVMLELIDQGQAQGALEHGQPERVGLVLFATIQGIAALVTSGIVQPQQLDELVADAIAHFLPGSRAAA